MKINYKIQFDLFAFSILAWESTKLQMKDLKQEQLFSGRFRILFLL